MNQCCKITKKKTSFRCADFNFMVILAAAVIVLFDYTVSISFISIRLNIPDTSQYNVRQLSGTTNYCTSSAMLTKLNQHISALVLVYRMCGKLYPFHTQMFNTTVYMYPLTFDPFLPDCCYWLNPGYWY